MRSFLTTVILLSFTLATPIVGQERAADAFVDAKLLISEGNYRQALESFRRAVELEPSDPYLRVELAKVLARINRLEQAREEAEAARAIAPANPDVLSLLGQIYTALGDEDPTLLPAAVAAYQESLEIEPDDPRIHHALGRVYRRLGDLEAAEASFRAAADLQPGSRGPAMVLLQILMEQGDNEGAIELLTDLVEESPHDWELRVSLSDLLSETGRLDEATAMLEAPEEAAAEAPSVEVERRLATLYYRQGRNAEAIETLDRVLAAAPDPRLRLFRALLLAEEQESERAIAELRELQASMPDEPELVMALARMLVLEGASAEAWAEVDALEDRLERAGDDRLGPLRLEALQLAAQLEDWDRVVQASGRLLEQDDLIGRPAVIGIRAEGLTRVGRVDEALDLLTETEDELLTAKRAELLFRAERPDEAVRLLDRLAEDPTQRGRVVEVYQRVGRYEESIPLLLDLRDQQPDSTQILFWLGAAYERTGRTTEAAGAFRDLLNIEPDFHLAMNYLGYMWAEQGENLDEALDLIRRAVDMQPNNPAYVDSLGWVYYQLGRYHDALEQLERAAVLLPTDETVLEHLGDAYRAVGDHDAAANAYRQAVGVAGENADAIEAKLSELETTGDEGR